jgi:hypothetical protein
MSSARTRLGACWSPKPAISRTGRSRKAFNTVAFLHDFMRPEAQRAIGEHYSKRPSAFSRSSEPPSADQSLRTGEPLRERPQLQPLQSLQLRAEQRRDRPLRGSRDCRTGRRSLCRKASIGLGFLGASPFGCENPCLCGLEFLGFPWILSSESNDINGLRGIPRGKIFVALLGREAGTGSCGRGLSGGRDWSWGKLSAISDYQQSFVVRPQPPQAASG